MTNFVLYVVAGAGVLKQGRGKVVVAEAVAATVVLVVVVVVVVALFQC